MKEVSSPFQKEPNLLFSEPARVEVAVEEELIAPATERPPFVTVN